MLETYYAGAYWLARQESAEVCARRAERFFHLLGHCDSAWTTWYQTANSFKQARQRPFSPDAATFQKLFSRQSSRIGDGFRYWLWTGDSPEEATSVNGGCGSSTPWVPSSCVLTPPAEGPLSERVLTAAVMTEVVRAMALAWEPEWALATSDDHRDLVSGGPHVGTYVGWVMYVSRLRGRVPPLPAPVRIEPVEDQGTLVILTPERFTVSNPKHVELASRVRELLERAGLLRPLRPWDSK